MYDVEINNLCCCIRRRSLGFVLRSLGTCRSPAGSPRTTGSPNLRRQSRLESLPSSLTLKNLRPATHRSCCTSVLRSPSWGRPCCTWSSLPPGPRSDSGSASSSSRLRSRSCTGSPGRPAAAWTGSFLLARCWRLCWRPVPTSTCCSPGRRCRSRRRGPSPWRRSLSARRRCYRTVCLKGSGDTDVSHLTSRLNHIC